MKITGRQQLACLRVQCQRSGGGYAQHPLHRRKYSGQEFNPAEFNLGEELFSAVDETWQSLKDTFSLSVLMNPIEASKGDGEMDWGDGCDGSEIR